MRIYSDKSLSDFQPWCGAVRTYDRISNAGLLDCLEQILEEEYPDGIDETELNDLFWFDADVVLHYCGLRGEDEIREELRDATERLQELTRDYLLDTEEMEKDFGKLSVMELRELWGDVFDRDYLDEFEEVEALINELQQELDGI